MLLGAASAAAEVPCADARIRICSENLERWGDPAGHGGEGHVQEQRDFLVERMTAAHCDVVALQEVFGRTKRESAQTADALAKALSDATGEHFRGSIGESEDPFIRNGYLVRTSKVEILRERSFLDEPLPRLGRHGPIAHYTRAPTALIARLRGVRSASLFLLNIHFKSKHDSFKDRSGTQFETMRMVMAEAARELLLREAHSGGRTVVPILLGDRNAGEESATAELLSGKRRIDDFQSGACGLSDDDDHVPQCRQSPHEVALIPLLATARRDSAPDVRGGSFSYRGKLELLDEIFISPAQLPRVRDDRGQLRVGFEGRFFKGSDHKMVWAELCLAEE